MPSIPKLRPAAVAGLFYPGEAASLRRAVLELLQHNPADGPAPRAVIAPHAAYVYSGPVAARAYNRVRTHAPGVRRVVLLGPAHRVALRGMALPDCKGFVTPLGEIPLDLELTERLRGLPGVALSDEAHAQEHSLEVQLPFLQSVLDEFMLVPLVVGHCASELVAALLDQVWDARDTLIVISSDLSHYHPYAVAQQLDWNTAERIEALDLPLSGDEACGAHPLNGLLQLARHRHSRVERLDLRNSGDTAGPRDRVVGYGAWAVCDA
ncbi:MAG TPA: AmmeMemoRadiSam system protein B [Gammaproteobacteria bacterium]|nr:AmmeMemoRadiSam system protein B [Gammaproteobacteria bacterium]